MWWAGVVSGGRAGFEGGAYGPPYQSHAAGASHTAGEIAFHTQAAVATKRSSNAIMFGCGGC